LRRFWASEVGWNDQAKENSWNERRHQGIIGSTGCQCGRFRFHLGNVGYIGWAAARSRHPGGVNVAFVDGHVKFKIDEIDFAVWEAIATIAGAEIIPGE
jgi:prepilin-type processing-associated H-X9-DG protein